MRLILVLLISYWSIATAYGQTPSATVPDQIFYNGKIITVDPSFHIAEAFAIKGDRFLEIASNAEIKKLAGPKTSLIDLHGRAVIPGLIDNHIHQYSAALADYRGVNLVGVQSLSEMMDRLRQAVANARPGETVITTSGWDESTFPERRAPTRQDLDAISPDRPIVVSRGRSGAYLNTAALKAAGITRDTKLVGGVPVLKDASGEPTGYFNNPPSVNDALAKIVPVPPLPELEEMLRKVQPRLNAWGFTSTREVELPAQAMRAYQALERDKKLTLRVSMGLGVNSTAADQMEEILQPWGVGPGFGDHWLRLDSISEFGMDLTSRPYLREPYIDHPGDRGSIRIGPEPLHRAMLAINRYGWRPAIHIMGDRALDDVLDAYEAANAESSIRDKRWVVEHIPHVHPDQMERMAKLGVLVSAQYLPYSAYEGMVRDLGKQRADRAVPMRELLDHHLIVSTGSDWNGVGEDNPFLNIYFYVTRKTKSGMVAGAAQKISREEALRVSTINNAYMTFEENVKGSIEAGKLADFLVLSEDILTIPETRINSIRPLATYVGGQRVFPDKSAAALQF